MSTPRKISLLPAKEQKKLFDKVISLKLKGFVNQQIAFSCNISHTSVIDILKEARKYNPNIPVVSKQNQVVTKQNQYKKTKRQTQLTDLSSYNKGTRFTRLFTDPNKKIETEAVTKNFYITKDFWLFNK